MSFVSDKQRKKVMAILHSSDYKKTGRAKNKTSEVKIEDRKIICTGCGGDDFVRQSDIVLGGDSELLSCTACEHRFEALDYDERTGRFLNPAFDFDKE